MTTGLFRSRYLEMHELRREATISSGLPESFSSVSAVEGMLSSCLYSHESNILDFELNGNFLAFDPTTFRDSYILHRTVAATKKQGLEQVLFSPQECHNKHMRSLIENAKTIASCGFDFKWEGVLCCTDIYTKHCSES